MHGLLSTPVLQTRVRLNDASTCIKTILTNKYFTSSTCRKHQLSCNYILETSRFEFFKVLARATGISCCCSDADDLFLPFVVGIKGTHLPSKIEHPQGPHNFPKLPENTARRHGIINIYIYLYIVYIYMHVCVMSTPDFYGTPYAISFSHEAFVRRDRGSNSQVGLGG